MNENLNNELQKIKDDLERLNNKYEKVKKEISEKEEEYQQMFDKILSGENINTNDIENELKNLRQDKINTISQISELKNRFKELTENNNLVKETKEDLEKTIELPKVDENKTYTLDEMRESLESTIELDKKEIMEKSSNPEDLEKTVELKIEDNIQEEKKSVSVLFDGSKGWYNIKCDDDTPAKIYGLDKNLLDPKSSKSIMTRARYGNDVDVCLVDALEQFDKEYNQNILKEYLEGNLNIMYDMRGFSFLKKEFLNSKEKKSFKEMIKNGKEKYNSKIVTFFSNKNLKKAAVTFGILAGGAVALSNINGTDKKENTSEIVTESNISKENDSEINKNDEIKTEEEKVEKNNTTENNDIEILDESTEKEVENNEKNIEKDEEIEQLSVETEDYKVGDKVNLNNVDIYSSSLYDGPMGNTSNINSKNFQVSVIAVTYGSEIVDVIKDNSISINEIREKYEKMYDPNINIAVNVNVLDDNGNVIQKNVGWFNSDKLYNSNENIKTK